MADWQDVEWTNLDLITEQKMDQMQENSDFLRDLLAIRPIATVPRAVRYANSYDSTPDWRVRWLVELGALSWYTEELSSAGDTSGESELVNIHNEDISSLSDGTRYSLRITAEVHTRVSGWAFAPNTWTELGNPGFPPAFNQTDHEILRTFFRKQPDMNYFSLLAVGELIYHAASIVPGPISVMHGGVGVVHRTFETW